MRATIQAFILTITGLIRLNIRIRRSSLSYRRSHAGRGVFGCRRQMRSGLAFVIGVAIVVAAPAFAYARHHRQSLIGVPFELPNRFNITSRLVFGAVLFGIGWGLSGICPGPGIVLAGSLETHALVFVGAVIAGSLLSDSFTRDMRA